MGQYWSKDSRSAPVTETKLQQDGNSQGIAVQSLNVNAQNDANVSISVVRTDTELTPSNEGAVNRKHWLRLIRKYNKDLNWMRPFPWDPDVYFEPEDFYVPLALDVYSRSGKVRKDEVAEFKELFDPVLKGGDRADYVLVRGEAGRGKSVICQKIASDWGKKISSIQALPCTDFLPIFYKLRSLRYEEDLGEEVFKFIHSVYSPDHEKSVVATRKIVKSLGNKVVVILDGYDEIDEETQKEVKKLLSLWRNTDDHDLSFASFLVTCRPTDEKEFLLLFDKQYYISKLSELQMKDLVTAYHGNNQTEIELFLQRYYELDLTDQTPLVICILCWLRKEPFNDESDTEDIIWSCIEKLAKRCNAREEFGFDDQQIFEYLRIFGGLCWTSSRPQFERWEIEDCCQSGSTFLFQMGILKHSEKDVYEAIHKLFFDVLAQKFLKTAVPVLENCVKRENFKNFFTETLGLHSTCRRQAYILYQTHYPFGLVLLLTSPCSDAFSTRFTFTNGDRLKCACVGKKDYLLYPGVHIHLPVVYVTVKYKERKTCKDKKKKKKKGSIKFDVLCVPGELTPCSKTTPFPTRMVTTTKLMVYGFALRVFMHSHSVDIDSRKKHLHYTGIHVLDNVYVNVN